MLSCAPASAQERLGASFPFAVDTVTRLLGAAALVENPISKCPLVPCLRAPWARIHMQSLGFRRSVWRDAECVPLQLSVQTGVPRECGLGVTSGVFTNRSRQRALASWWEAEPSLGARSCFLTPERLLVFPPSDHPSFPSEKNLFCKLPLYLNRSYRVSNPC